MGGLKFYEDESGNKYVVGADSVPKKLGNASYFISINEYKSQITPTYYSIGFKAKIIFCGSNVQAGFEWYNSDTNKHYYNADINNGYNLGSYGPGSTYKFDSIDDNGFTFNVGLSSYINTNLIIIAFG